MKFSQYSPLALRTAKPLTQEQNLRHAAILLVSEAGEIADAIKAFAIYGKPLDKVNLVEEVGDLLWGLNLYITARGRNPRTVDEVVVMHTTFEVRRISDPWKLVDLAILIGAFASNLGTPSKSKKDSKEELLHSLCWSLILLLDYVGVTFEHALATNIAKLAKRYGDKYSDYKALNRDTEVERVALEGGDAEVN